MQQLTIGSAKQIAWAEKIRLETIEGIKRWDWGMDAMSMKITWCLVNSDAEQAALRNWFLDDKQSKTLLRDAIIAALENANDATRIINSRDSLIDVAAEFATEIANQENGEIGRIFQIALNHTANGQSLVFGEIFHARNRNAA